MAAALQPRVLATTGASARCPASPVAAIAAARAPCRGFSSQQACPSSAATTSRPMTRLAAAQMERQASNVDEPFMPTRYDGEIHNLVELIGTTGPEPIQLEAADYPYARFPVSVAPAVQKPGVNPDWFWVELKGDLAAAAPQVLQPNSPVYVAGRLRIDKYQQDGSNRVAVYVEASKVWRIVEGQGTVDLNAERTNPRWTRSDGSSPPPRGDGGYARRPPQSDGPTGPRLTQDQKWEQFFNAPGDFYDNRAEKASGRKADTWPDFKHKSNRDLALWVSGKYPPPQWVQERLAQMDAGRR